MARRTLEEVARAGGYNIIYADPAWKYRQGGRGAARNHYKEMTLEAICALPVAELAARDAVLFIWATHPNLPMLFPVLRDWGFEYKTLGFMWVKYTSGGKPAWGGGHWARANTEPCYIAVRGDIRRINAGVHQLIESWDGDEHVIRAPRTEHSAKPAEARARIVELMGDLPRIELFAREKAPGWDVWGNQVKSDVVMRPRPARRPRLVSPSLYAQSVVAPAVLAHPR